MSRDQSLSSPQFKAPPGACDTHMHIVGPEDRFPFAPGNEGRFPEYPLAAYDKIAEQLGIERSVVVMTHHYKTDHRLLLDTLDRMGNRARGVAVVDTTVSLQQLKQLTEKGVRGASFYMFRSGIFSWDMVEAIARHIADCAWHAQVQLDGLTLPDYFDFLRKLPCDLVIDHIGKFQQAVKPDHPSFQALLKLIEGGRCYVKLSAPYESSTDKPPFLADSGTLAKELIRQAPERMLWGSNWPHLGAAAGAKPDDAELLACLAIWAGDEQVYRKILSDNPATLYGFS